MTAEQVGKMQAASRSASLVLNAESEMAKVVDLCDRLLSGTKSG